MSAGYRVERQLPCGNWGKVQTISRSTVDLAEIPKGITRNAPRGKSRDKDKIIEDYAHLVYTRWLTARPKEHMRLVKES